MTDQTALNLKELAGITLLNDEGQPVSLANYAGQRVLVFFFPKADTPGCTAQACGFRDAFPQISETGATVIGISADTPEALAKWKKKKALPYTLLSDPNHVVMERFKVWGQKSLFGKKYMGILRSHFVFDAEGRLETSEVQVSPADSITKGVASLINPVVKP